MIGDKSLAADWLPCKGSSCWLVNVTRVLLGLDLPKLILIQISGEEVFVWGLMHQLRNCFTLMPWWNYSFSEIILRPDWVICICLVNEYSWVSVQFGQHNHLLGGAVISERESSAFVFEAIIHLNRREHIIHLHESQALHLWGSVWFLPVWQQQTVCYGDILLKNISLYFSAL